MIDAYFLGMDGGQSSTLALIGDGAGRVLGSGRGGPCFAPRDAILGSVSAACASAGLNPRTVRFHAACLGFSGGPVGKEAIAREILAVDRMLVTDDALIALTGATAGAPGIIVIAGTGSIAFGRNGAGKTARAGGWGYLFGDEGGGFDITRQALRAALAFEEGWGPATALHPLLLQATTAASANDLMHRFYTDEYSRPRIAAFSTLVDAAALAGDRIAVEIVTRSAQHLASMSASVRQQLFAAGDAVRVAYIGGVFGSRILLERFRMLVELGDANQVDPPAYGPAAGALLEAYRSAGIEAALTNVPEEKSC